MTGRRLGRETWSLVVPEDWSAELDGGLLTIEPEGHDFALQISTYFKEDDVTDADLSGFAAEYAPADCEPGWVEVGAFSGLWFETLEERAACRYWLLRNGQQMLFVTLVRDAGERGMHEDAVERALDTLRPEGEATA